VFFVTQFCVDDPSKTFWDDPNMYVDDPGLDTLFSLTADQLLSSSSNENAIITLPDDDDDDDDENDNDDDNDYDDDQHRQRDEGNNGGQQRNGRMRQRKCKRNADKHTQVQLVCAYPNCDKSYLKPSHLKASV